MTLDEVIESITQKGERELLLVATANREGIPHVAAANTISQPAASQVAITDWFCPATVANCAPGRPVSIVIWNPEEDSGYQLIGQVAKIEDIAMMDGYLPGEKPLPQVERRLLIDVERILAFSRGPHSDVEE